MGDNAILARSPLLARIAREDLKALLAAALECSFRAGEPLFARGDPGEGLYAIAKGDVRVLLQGADGSDVTLAVLGPGDVLGELSLLDGSPRSATAVALAPVRALHVSTERFQAWLVGHPQAARSMLAELARRLRHTDEQLAELALLDVETRLARRLWHRFAAAPHGALAGMKLRVNQRELAAVLGITRESVNKHMARLKARGLIGVDGGYVTLLQPEALRGASEQL